MKYHMELVCWEDAAQWDEEIQVDELDDDGCIFTTVGFVVRETTRYLYLARDVGGSIRRTIAIPIGMIQWRQQLCLKTTQGVLDDEL